jgi:hypothetical protein
MKKARWWWKAAAVLMCAFVAGNTIYVASRPQSPIHFMTELSLVVAALGNLQYAFGWPKLPRLLWRIVGPLYSVAMLWPIGSAIGWLAAGLAIKSLTAADQIGTWFMIGLLAGYVLMIVVPLFRLGEWHRVGRKEPEIPEELGLLVQTFQ